MEQKEIVVEIIVDHREAASGLVDELFDYTHATQEYRLTTDVKARQLEIGDIICSDRVGIERKSVSDFVDTITSPERDMPRQMVDLSRAFTRPLMILEGESVFGLRGISPEALRAHMAMVTVGFGVPILPTMDVAQTAAQIVTIARREQFKRVRSISIPHMKRSNMSLDKRQEYVVSSIGGGVGAETARTLLKHFGSVINVVNATLDELCEVKDIGKKTAESIHEITRSEYKK